MSWQYDHRKPSLTSPAHGVDVFRSAKRTLSLFQSGHHHICLLASFHDSCFFLPAAASAQLSRRKWRALSGLVGYPAFGKWNFSKRGRECSRPEAESIEGWTVWLADSVQSAVGLAERVLVMHFSR